MILFFCNFSLAEPGIDTSKCVKRDQNEGDNIEEDTEICLCNDELCNSYTFPTEGKLISFQNHILYSF